MSEYVDYAGWELSFFDEAINFRENISTIIRDFNFEFGVLYIQNIDNYNINFVY